MIKFKFEVNFDEHVVLMTVQQINKSPKIKNFIKHVSTVRIVESWSLSSLKAKQGKNLTNISPIQTSRLSQQR